MKNEQKISLNELKPNETFGEWSNGDRSGQLSDEEIQRYLHASAAKKRRIEIGALGYPITDTDDTENKE